MSVKLMPIIAILCGIAQSYRFDLSREFQNGYIPLGNYTYDYYERGDLHEAIKLCKDVTMECAGITWRPVMKSNDYFIIYFHAFLPAPELTPDGQNWSFWRSSQDFVFMEAIVTKGDTLFNISSRVLWDRGDRDRKCVEIGCVAYTLCPDTNTITYFGAVRSVKPVNDNSKELWIRNTQEASKNFTYPELKITEDDVCCKSEFNFMPKYARKLKRLDKVKRDSCNIPYETFVKHYERPRKWGIFRGCTKGWRAYDAWKPRHFLKRFSPNSTWRVIFGDRQQNDEDVPMTKVQQLHHSGSPYHLLEKVDYNKSPQIELLDDYTVPHLFQNDLWFYNGGVGKVSGHFDALRWFQVATQGTATRVNLDPAETDSWNSLIFGQKLWAIFPKEYAPEYEILDCSPKCSDTREDGPWFNAILGKAAGFRNVSFLVQEPGETLYLPYGYAKAEYNIKFSVSVTQNYHSVENIFTVIKELGYNDPFVLDHFKNIYHLGYLNANQRKEVRAAFDWKWD